MATRRILIVVSRLSCALAISCGFTGCSQTPTAPSAIVEPLRFSAHLNQSLITPATTGTLTFRLENLTGETVTLNFATSCQINPYVTESASNAVVFPQGGGWGCASVVTEMILPARSAATKEVMLVSSPAPVYLPGPQVLGLPTGDYAAYGTIDHAKYQMRSETLRFSVQR